MKIGIAAAQIKKTSVKIGSTGNLARIFSFGVWLCAITCDVLCLASSIEKTIGKPRIYWHGICVSKLRFKNARKYNDCLFS